MNDREHLKRQIEDAQQGKRDPLPSVGNCELCGRWDSHLLNGECPQCRAKYHPAMETQ